MKTISPTVIAELRNNRKAFYVELTELQEQVRYLSSATEQRRLNNRILNLVAILRGIDAILDNI